MSLLSFLLLLLLFFVVVGGGGDSLFIVAFIVGVVSVLGTCFVMQQFVSFLDLLYSR